MNLNHVALVVSSKENAEHFFSRLLGLEIIRTQTVPADLSRQLFDLPAEYSVILYGNEDFRVEAFIPQKGAPGPQPGPLAHLCLEVTGREAWLDRAAALGLEVRRAQKGESIVVFVKDFDGNLYEIKEKSTLSGRPSGRL